MDYVSLIKKELKTYADAEKATDLMRFFKTKKGEYGEGDKFIGITVPNQRAVAKKYYNLCSLSEDERLLKEKIHEFRLTALMMLVCKFEKSKEEAQKKAVVDLYLKNTPYINNWDLVDLSAYKILGAYLFDKDRSVLHKLADSDNLWEQRISVISTFYFIRQKDYKDTMILAKKLLGHKHDLMHKAVGWMLREVGKRDYNVLFSFLKEHYMDMPRTMLRYAIEKFEESIRQDFLKGRI